ncbi:DUF2905 domain-containing protein [Bacillota bacterium LX-D]|nr:DUF2905 domain-containing protein [Bacillota bacterium LX-D]
MDFGGMGKTIIIMGVVLVFIGLLLIGAGKIPFLGKLPGDFFWHKGSYTFYFPLATSILISLLLTILLNIFFRK